MFEGIMQPMHLLVILIIALLFFGPSKLGELGKGLGDGIRHFKKAMKEDPSAPAPAETRPAVNSAPAAENKTEVQK
ncbi:MAG TPA: twin-arginine translocase TatA/TatE family subunit [Candidatus Angelobacter sp.]|nr:twin-arginine translocase TatA/TatE family subunit [Candidatus Angelobacter sp.]